jgi:flagella basal body P-ring formation protein FlgA
MKRLLSLAAFISLNTLACEVILPGQVVVLGADPSGFVITTKNCTDAFRNDLHQLLTDVDGKITSVQISEMLSTKGHGPANFTPYLVHVRQLKSLLRERLELPAGIQVKSTRGVNSPNIIALNAGDQLEIDCASCLYGQQQALRVNVRSFDGSSRSIEAMADFRKMVRAYEFTVIAPAFSDIRPKEMLKEVYVESLPHTDLVTDMDQLKFFKTNKPIRPGELLKRSDLNALNLVRAGSKTEVVIENTMVRIKTHGISRSNGTLGELVEVYHQQKNKKYSGKVIDHNKVLVEL